MRFIYKYFEAIILQVTKERVVVSLEGQKLSLIYGWGLQVSNPITEVVTHRLQMGSRRGQMLHKEMGCRLSHMCSR